MRGMLKFLAGKTATINSAEKPSRLVSKPIFRGEFIAFSEIDRYALADLIKRLRKPFLRIAEIGSWTGNGSTRAIVEEIRGGGGVLYCIDHWQGNPGVQRHQDLVSEYDMFATFRFNVSMFGGSKFVKPLVMTSKDASGIVKDSFFDLVFIDGDHSYDQTLSDIELWLPKVAQGGILCGHDCEERPAGPLDKSRLWENRTVDTIESHREFPRIHPGVILAVADKFGTSAHLWAEELITLEDGTVGRSTVWDVSVGRL